MTICNMSIEGGARAGMIAPDEKTYAFIKGRPKAPKGGAWDLALRHWETLFSEEGAFFDSEIKLDAAKLPPIVTWGTSPEDVVSIAGVVPDPAKADNENKRASMQRALDYMGLKPGTKMTDVPLDVVWIGSCTNGRIEDLRAVAEIVDGKKISERLAYAMIVPGSGLVKAQAEAEGLDKIFKDAGFEWREPGCSMCLGMNPDQLKPGPALRLDLEPQLRGTPGTARTHASAVAGHGGGGGHRGPLRRHSQLGRLGPLVLPCFLSENRFPLFRKHSRPPRAHAYRPSARGFRPTSRTLSGARAAWRPGGNARRRLPRCAASRICAGT